MKIEDAQNLIDLYASLSCLSDNVKQVLISNLLTRL